MAMRPCEKCLENRWNIETRRGVNEEKKTYEKWAVATCELCGNEVEFGHKELSLYHKDGRLRFKV